MSKRGENINMIKKRHKHPEKYEVSYAKIYKIIRKHARILDFALNYDFSMGLIQNINRNNNITIHTLLRLKEALEDLTGRKIDLNEMIEIKEKKKNNKKQNH